MVFSWSIIDYILYVIYKIYHIVFVMSCNAMFIYSSKERWKFTNTVGGARQMDGSLRWRSWALEESVVQVVDGNLWVKQMDQHGR